MFPRVQPYVLIAASLTLSGLLLGSWAIAKDEGRPAKVVVVSSAAQANKAMMARRTRALVPAGRLDAATGAAVADPFVGASASAGPVGAITLLPSASRRQGQAGRAGNNWAPSPKSLAPVAPRHGLGIGYGLHAGSAPVTGHAGMREASAGAASVSPTPLGLTSVGVLRPPLDSEPVRAVSLRADIARYTAERSGHWPAASGNATDAGATAQSYSPAGVSAQPAQVTPSPYNN